MSKDVQAEYEIDSSDVIFGQDPELLGFESALLSMVEEGDGHE